MQHDTINQSNNVNARKTGNNQLSVRTFFGKHMFPSDIVICEASHAE